MKKYHVHNYTLYEGNFRRDMNRALHWSIPLTLLVTIFILTRVPIPSGIFFGLLLFLVLTYGIYEQIREKISVGDALDGRYFKCRSVIMLAGKEQLMNNLSVIFCRFLEAMKTWGGQEIIQLGPYNLPEIRIVEFPPYAYS